MEKLYYHCETCTPSNDYLNITCIEELKEHISFNLVTIILCNWRCKDCASIEKELIIEDFVLTKGRPKVLHVYNLKLIEDGGFFWIDSSQKYKKYVRNDEWVIIDKSELFDLIKGKSVLVVSRASANEHKKLVEEHYDINYLQGDITYDYYTIARPTLIKPAVKRSAIQSN